MRRDDIRAVVVPALCTAAGVARNSCSACYKFSLPDVIGELASFIFPRQQHLAGERDEGRFWKRHLCSRVLSTAGSRCQGGQIGRLLRQEGQQEKGECVVCSVPIRLITNPGAGGAKSYAQRSQAKGMKGDEVVRVNMHRLGESFVEKVSDDRRQATVA